MLPTIYFANDHAGYEIKQAILDHLKTKGYQVVDLDCKRARWSC